MPVVVQSFSFFSPTLFIQLFFLFLVFYITVSSVPLPLTQFLKCYNIGFIIESADTNHTRVLRVGKKFERFLIKYSNVQEIHEKNRKNVKLTKNRSRSQL